MAEKPLFPNEPDLTTAIETYLQALEDRDLKQCLSFYAEDSTIHFGSGVYQGHKGITEWHQDRFRADLQVLEVKGVSAQDNQVVLELQVTSNRLKAWRVKTLRGKGTFEFENNKIKEVRFSLAGLPSINVYEGWR